MEKPSPPSKKVGGLGITAELGVTGLERFGGEIADEFLRELRGDRGRKNLREFADNCPVAGAVLTAVRSLAKGATWRIVPGLPDRLHTEQADFIDGAMFDDMSQSWNDNLTDILSFMSFGWSLKEMVFKVRGGASSDPKKRSKFADGRIGWRKWGLRAQESLDEWEFDDAGGVQGMWQDPGGAGSGRRFIPIEKSLLFRTDATKGNPEGRSLLRNAWVPYYRKKHIEAIATIGIERDLAGYPVFQQVQPDPEKGLEVPDIFDPDDTDAVNTYNEFKKIVKSARRGEQEGMVLPWWMKFDLVSSSGRRQFDLDKVLARYDRLVALTMLADFLFIGHDAVGSKALVQSRMQLFTASLEGLLSSVTDIVNRFAIPQLLALNGMPTDAPPRLDHGQLVEIDLDVLGDYVTKLSGAGMPLFGNDDSESLQTALLERGHLPTQGVAEATGV